MEVIEVGCAVPQVALPDQEKQVISLNTLRGKRILLSFHPLAWTGVCQRQMEALEMNYEALTELDAIALGISVDPVPSKAAWAKSIGVEKMRLLSDFWPHGGFAKSLGIFREADGVSERANIIVDTAGVVEWVKVYPIGEAPDLNEVLEALGASNDR